MDTRVSTDARNTFESGCLNLTPPRVRTIFGRLALRSRTFHLAVTILGFLAIAGLDPLLDPSYTLLDFYLIPIVYALWFLGTDYALLISCASIITPGVQDWVESTHPGGHVLVPYWNLLSNLGLFGLVVWLLALLKDALEHDRRTERQRADREMDIARQVQLRLLPSEAPTIPGLEAGCAYKAARAVGGDYYDFVPLGNGRLGVAVGDVSGKGLAAALLMATLQGLIRTGLPLAQANLSEFMNGLNHTLYGLTDSNRYSTLFIGVYDSGTGTLEYVNAGHNSPFLLRRHGGGEMARTSFAFDSGGPPLGILPNSKYSTGHLSLSEGDLLIVYTDGVVEAEAPDDDQFGELRLEECAAGACQEAPAEICARVLNAVNTFTATAPQFDDITLVVLRATGQVHQTGPELASDLPVAELV